MLGASYAGHRATQLLVSYLPLNWRVVVLERNTHFNREHGFCNWKSTSLSTDSEDLLQTSMPFPGCRLCLGTSTRLAVTAA